ncbi:MAG: DNA translocase FtsK [Candidatus Acididesulfobacter diazotrophicus]|uniref:DNA translocase FtsK n=1 Tax=Candidatus Acididesulfobacter diazotrophicus TaxID=2597226 RepID=A0A519BQD9_9DELT|nr:MAG: DNA translocase FtsK [Candidatus Acididesulfobacter diazotrophicus]
MERYKKFLSAIVVILFAIYCLLSLLSYNIYQISSNSYSIAAKHSINLGGELGSYLSMWMLQFFGYGYFLLILIFLILGTVLLITKKDYKFYTGLILFYINSLIFLNLIISDSSYHRFNISGGGLIGEELSGFGKRWLGEIGVILIILLIYTIVFLLLFDNYDLKKALELFADTKNKLKTKINGILKIKINNIDNNEKEFINNNHTAIKKSFINNLKEKYLTIINIIKLKLKINTNIKNNKKDYNDLKSGGKFNLDIKNGDINNEYNSEEYQQYESVLNKSNKSNELNEQKYDPIKILSSDIDDKKQLETGLAQLKSTDTTNNIKNEKSGNDFNNDKINDINSKNYGNNVSNNNIENKNDITKSQDNPYNDFNKNKDLNNKNHENNIDNIKNDILESNDNRGLNFQIINKENEIPPLSILPIKVLDSKQKIDKIELTQNAKIIEKKLSDLGIKGRITGIEPGPIITMYEFEPESGVKVGKIQTVSEDLTMALKSRSVRITGVIQGKSAVGIEVPNSKRETVYFSELINSAEFKNSKSLLSIVLGKGPKGNNAVFDLAQCPHLLVAGSTGSGKSVFLNTLITSILFKATYEEVNFLMIDPKRLELTFYEGLPHLVTDVVCDPKKAAAALSWAVREMEERYKNMQEAKVRNIEQYNRYLKQNHKPILPFLVIIIDELSDLMLVSPKDVETSIMRLSQMARACGIHLVIATQRPSVNVITGIIKANMPSRIAFLVSSKVDSRTILDSNGAEELLGSGDMLFMPPGQGKLLRIHGAYVSEKEIKKVIDSIIEKHLPSQKKESLINEFEKSNNFDRITENSQDEDLYNELLDLIDDSEMEYVSISFVQRRFRIGFNRAARLIERLQGEGILNNKGRVNK